MLLISHLGHAAEERSAYCDKAFKSFLRQIKKQVSSEDLARRSLNESKMRPNIALHTEPNNFSEPLRRNLKNIIAELGFKTSSEYIISRASFNSKLNLVVFKVPSPSEKDMSKYNRIVVARIFKNGNAELLGTLGEAKDWTKERYSEVSFIGDTNVVRVLTHYRNTRLAPNREDYTFYDLSGTKPQMLPSITHTTGYKFRDIYSFADNIYYAQLVDKTEHVFFKYVPQTQIFTLFYKGHLDPQLKDQMKDLSETLSVKVEGDFVTFEEKRVKFTVNSRDGVMQILKLDSLYTDEPLVVNNKPLSARMQKLDLKEDAITGEMTFVKSQRDVTHSTLVLWNNNHSAVVQKWVVEGGFNINRIYQVEGGFVVERDGEYLQNLLYLKNDGSIVELTAPRERLLRWSVINNTVVGFSLPKKDNTADLVIIPIKDVK